MGMFQALNKIGHGMAERNELVVIRANGCGARHAHLQAISGEHGIFRVTPLNTMASERFRG